jgi:hypothetical protein
MYEQDLCGTCGEKPQMANGKKNGKQVYKPRCRECHDILYRKPYKAFKKEHCEECGFVAVHRIQLDVHHIDHDHNNNVESNLKTLCANCHRLEHV